MATEISTADLHVGDRVRFLRPAEYAGQEATVTRAGPNMVSDTRAVIVRLDSGVEKWICGDVVELLAKG